MIASLYTDAYDAELLARAGDDGVSHLLRSLLYRQLTTPEVAALHALKRSMAPRTQ